MATGALREIGQIIQFPSASLLCVDTTDALQKDRNGFIIESNVADARIYQGRTIQAGFMRRLALTEANINWNIPNVNSNNNTLLFRVYDTDGNPGDFHLATINRTGFFPAVNLAKELADALNYDFEEDMTAFRPFQVVITEDLISPVTDYAVFPAYSASSGVVPPNFRFGIRLRNQFSANTEEAVTIAPVVGDPITLTLTVSTTSPAQFQEGMEVLVVDTDNADNYFNGTVTSYNVSTGEIVIDVTEVEGTYGTAVTYSVTEVPLSIGSFKLYPSTTQSNIVSPTTAYNYKYDDLTYALGIPITSGSNSYSQIFGYVNPPTVYTPYIDIVSDTLTLNQPQRDASTNPQDNYQKLARIYLSNESLSPRDIVFTITADGSVSCTDSQPGTYPFIVRREFSHPKQIAWNTTQNISNINLQIIDYKGQIIPIEYKSISETNVETDKTIVYSANFANYQFTLQVSEN